MNFLVISFLINLNTPFYAQWWFILFVLLFFSTYIYIIFNLSSNYTKELIKNYSKSSTSLEQAQLMLLVIGLVIPFIDGINELLRPRETSALPYDLGLTLIFLSIYFMSKKIRLVQKHIFLLLNLIIILHTFFTGYKILFWKYDIAIFVDVVFCIFSSYYSIKNIKFYWIYNGIIIGFLSYLFVNKQIPITDNILLFNIAIIFLAFNSASYFAILNTKDKFLFANELINNTNVLTLAINRKCEIIFCSKSSIDLLGFTPSELIGLEFKKLIQDSNFNINNKFNNPNKLYVHILKCKNGALKNIQWKYKIFDDDLIVGSGYDITEQVHIQFQYQNLLENAYDIIYETNQVGNFTFINKFTEEILGYTKEEMYTKHFASIIREDYREEIILFYSNYTSQTKIFPTAVFPVIKKSGQVIWISQNATLKRDTQQNNIGFTAIARDISFLKKQID